MFMWSFGALLVLRNQVRNLYSLAYKPAHSLPSWPSIVYLDFKEGHKPTCEYLESPRLIIMGYFKPIMIYFGL